jgi:hypothetical protein
MDESIWWRHSRPRLAPRLAVTAVAAATVAGLLSLGPMSGRAAASLTGSATLKLSGAGRGTLREGSGGLCTNARGEGVDLIDLVGSIAGFKGAATWSLVVASQSTKAGTYKIAPGGGSPGGQLDPMVTHSTPTQSEKAILNSSAGSYTFKGEAGTLDVTFGAGKKAITVKGSWNCRA